MTVAELIEKLRTLPLDLPVVTLSEFDYPLAVDVKRESVHVTELRATVDVVVIS